MKTLAWTILLTLILCHNSPAQMGMGGGGGGGQGSYALEDDERNLKFAAIPIPSYSDIMGFGLGVVATSYYKLDRHDDELPPSSTGVFGFYSENNSWVGAAFQTLHYDEDKWRGKIAFGAGSVKYQFNPAALSPGFPDIFLDYTTATNFYYLGGLRRARENLYFGAAFLSWSAQVTLEPEVLQAPEERYSGPGLSGQWDTRDNMFSATSGTLVDARLIFYDQAFGSDRNFEKLNLTISGYTALGDSTKILAARLFSETAYGNVPFSGQSILSGNRNLRGYANGRHRGNQLISMEVEYRWNFWRRWGLATFTGVAFVAQDLKSQSLAGALPAAGLGLRYRMIEAYKISVRVDVGWGKDDHGIYFSIGEAF